MIATTDRSDKMDEGNTQDGRAETREPVDTSITKIDSRFSPRGPDGERYLASGVSLSMRLWQHEPQGELKEPRRREYETVGYAVSGRAELEIEGQKVLLSAGDSWVVPRGAMHRYRVLESFTAVEATHPPAQVHGRDD
jgi:quercetin dioxygenase-like cupin family protein